jgi:hypothetical protein
MKINAQSIQQVMVATALTSGNLSAGVAASAQTTAAPAAQSASANATNVGMATMVNAKAKRQAQLEQDNADTRRVEFLHQGTSI